MASKVYFTVTGISKWAVINGLWAAIRHKDFLPDKVVIIVTSGHENDAGEIMGWMDTLLKSRGKEAEISKVNLQEDNFAAVGKKISRLIEEEKSSGNEVALDITPGRKAIVSSAILAAREKEADHVFYLYIENLRNAARPYPMIPFHLQHFVDLQKEVWS
ncbi:MAG TPA: hypothetical protein ENN25_01225 [Euryarchaeota archaeon]|nr:hypothetical protein [Euryarchaeota archaeon]